jgi:hypothetical protein
MMIAQQSLYHNFTAKINAFVKNNPYWNKWQKLRNKRTQIGNYSGLLPLNRGEAVFAPARSFKHRVFNRAPLRHPWLRWRAQNSTPRLLLYRIVTLIAKITKIPQKV